MPTAEPDDVRVEIDTELTDTDINSVLDRVYRDVDRMSGSPSEGTDKRKDIEATLAAYRIVTGNAPDAQDRTATSVSVGSTSVDYDSSVAERLKNQLRFLGVDESLIDAERSLGKFEVF